QGQVEEAKRAAEAGNAERGGLDTVFPVDAERALERDDLVGVQPGGGEVLAAEPAHDLVDRVERDGSGDLDRASVRPAGDCDAHGTNLGRAAARPGSVHTTSAVRRAGVVGRAWLRWRPAGCRSGRT